MKITTLVTCCATTEEATKMPSVVGGVLVGVRSRSARNLSVSVSVRDRVSGKRVDDGVSDEATDSECERMSCGVVCVWCQRRE